MDRASQVSQLKPLYDGLLPKTDVGNLFRHFEQPKLALKFENPQNLRVAGRSHAIHARKALIVILVTPDTLVNETPLKRTYMSFTKGERKVLICCLGSFGPGIISTSKTFSSR